MDVCVLIPHYNNPDGLAKSINSIDEELDIIVVDDGSKIKFEEREILEKASNEVNIQFLYLEENKGIEYALNEGLEFILKLDRYKYVARLDCGDICHSQRFEKQSSFLTANKHVALVGTWANVVDLKDNLLFKVKPPLNHKILKNKMFFNCMFIHPSVMFRLSIIDLIGYYPCNYDAAEDYAFFFKIINRFETANIAEYLITYQIDPNSVSAVKRKKQVLSRIKVIKEHFYFGYYPLVGLLRNYLLLFLPLNIINYVKLILKKK